MTTESFDNIPDHARNVFDQYPIESIHLTPLDRLWKVPVAVWDARQGFDGTDKPDCFNHHTLIFQSSRSLVQRVSARGSVLEEDGGTSDALWMQSAESDHRWFSPGHVKFTHLYFQMDFLQRLGAELYRSERGGTDLLSMNRALQRNRELRHLAEAYVGRARSPDNVPCALEMDARATVIGFAILRAYSIHARQSPMLHRGGLAPWQLRRACEYLESRLADDIALTDLAEETKLSPFHFARAFKVSMGVPPYAYLTRLRLERAKALLVDTDKSVTEIALDCGYESSQALARLFQREIGCTPSAWRRERRSN